MSGGAVISTTQILEGRDLKIHRAFSLLLGAILASLDTSILVTLRRPR
jgi:hypothetical protein